MTAAPLPFAALLRRELDEHVAALGRRRTAVRTVYVGAPGVDRVQVATDGLAPDQIGWRADLLERAIDGAAEPVCAWITRSGELVPGDDDQAWCAAAHLAFARHGLTLPGFYVLNRTGWHELVSGQVVTFYRVRRR